jgi:hypothetical protein
MRLVRETWKFRAAREPPFLSSQQGAKEEAMERCIVESTYDTPLSEQDEKQGSAKIDAYLAEHGARWLRSLYTKDRTHIVCEFEAPDEKTVAEAYGKANMPYDRVWSAVVYEAEHAPA